MLSFHVKFVQTARWRDGHYAPDLLMQGYKKMI